MTPSHIQELRELADALQTQADWLAEYQHHWTACEQDAKFLLQIVTNVREAYPALRACADREERAQAGVTAVVVGAALEARSKHLAEVRECDDVADDLDEYEAMRLALESAALALQVDREKAEPVAWRYELPVGNWQYFDGPIDDDNLDACKQGGLTAQNLYTHPTAPAEADERPLR